ncbi:hypothetical protein EWM62_10685 [Mucilaginibacter terrigena]|uniref:Outer membrane protein beta-barrel domain-containing protein n=1 Tax=Mucilaginibacter terrigena TaxID=2492395 RepID=A0A4Q5LM20_9SPHI|nr:hypothetical protein [Mucilaginibacter terrigena]RYU90002.1 hypothetical protein EWM62_10685 [Mucilaginibacter terrigena]
MKKLLLLLAIVGGISFTASAQSDKARFSIGFEGGLPIGSTSDVYNVGLGGSLKYEMPIGSGTMFTISGGYTSFKVKDVFGGGSVGFVPAKAGIKYFFSDGFYGEGQVGAAFSTESGGGTAFAYAPGIGYALEGGFDIGVRYEAWSKNGTISQIGVRIAYGF